MIVKNMKDQDNYFLTLESTFICKTKGYIEKGYIVHSALTHTV